MEFLRSGRFRFYLLVFLCSLFFSIKIYRNSGPILTGWDVFGYYLYLPQTVIYKDIAIKDYDRILKIYKEYQLPGTIYQVNHLDNGNRSIKYTTGWAILNFPFFCGAHIYAKINDYPQDGFSAPYQKSVMIACIFYMVLGLFLVGKLLLRYFSIAVSSWIFLLLVFGTNYYYIITDSFTMPHLHLFTLYAAFILFTDNWHKKPDYKNSICLGATLGLMTLVRPTEIIALLIPLLWGVFSWADFKNRLKQLFSLHLKRLLVIGAGFVIVSLPQLLYWKIVTGKFLYYGYDNAGEGFEFLQPYTLKVLFSFRKGWLIYTPLAVFFIAGFFFMKKNPWKNALLVFFLLNLYIVSCWSNWWYADSFSQRPLMHSLPVLLLPFGFFIQHILVNRRYYWMAILIPLTALNIFQTWQANVGILHSSRMTFAYYKAIFLKTYVPEGAEKLLLVDRSAAGEANFNPDNYTKSHEFFDGFEKSDFDHLSREEAHSGKKSCVVAPDYPYSFCYEAEFSEITGYDHAWLKVSMWIKMSDSVQMTLPTLVTTFEHRGEPYYYKGVNLETDTTKAYLPGEWIYIETFYMTPEVRRKSDKFKAYLWLRGKGKVFVDDMQIEIFEPNY